MVGLMYKNIIFRIMMKVISCTRFTNIY